MPLCDINSKLLFQESLEVCIEPTLETPMYVYLDTYHIYIVHTHTVNISDIMFLRFEPVCSQLIYPRTRVYIFFWKIFEVFISRLDSCSSSFIRVKYTITQYVWFISRTIE